MESFLLILVVFTTLSAVTSIKEWKNFENGKVYSHKLPSEKNEVPDHEQHKSPNEEERLLHSRHRDKKMKASSLQVTDIKPKSSKKPGRHHRGSVEEETHLRPLKERHHKFPNPDLLAPVKERNPTRLQTGKDNSLKKNKYFSKTKNDRNLHTWKDKRPNLNHMSQESQGRPVYSTLIPQIDGTVQYPTKELNSFFDP